MKQLKLCLIMFLVVFFTSPVLAKTTQDISFQAGENIIQEKEILGSNFMAANNIESNGKIDGINVIAGNNIKINNESEYVITAGNIITINGSVEKDVIVAGNTITIEDDAVIGRDLVVCGSEVIISGTINRNVKVYAERVKVLNGTINGNMKIAANTIVIDTDSVIVGKVKYNESADTTLESEQIGSTVTYKETEQKKTNYLNQVLSSGISYMGFMLVFMVMMLLVPRVFENVKKMINKMDATKPFMWFVIGFAGLILMPVLAIFLLISTIGTVLGGLLLAIYFIILMLANVFTGYLLGNTIYTRLFKKENNILIEGLIGIACLFVLSLIPYVNTLVSFISILVGFGMILNMVKPKKSKA